MVMSLCSSIATTCRVWPEFFFSLLHPLTLTSITFRLKQTLIDMGKILQPLSSVKVECDPAAAKSTARVKEAEYCEAFDDEAEYRALLKEMKQSNEVDQFPNPKPHHVSRPSEGFARVVRRQSSTVGLLHRFGKVLSDITGHDTEEEEEETRPKTA